MTQSLATFSLNAPQRQPHQMPPSQAASGYEHPSADVECMDVRWKNTIFYIQLPPQDQSKQADPNPAKSIHNHHTTSSTG